MDVSVRDGAATLSGMAESNEAKGELTMRVPAMPADANAAGDVFGGWVMAHMDQAGGIAGILHDGTALPMVQTMLAFALGSAGAYWFVARPVRGGAGGDTFG